ncbi:hypothetical protein PRZ48_013722 [Zasmidium cellare]|uniref:Uncharacterized protein n=1 Tax=Zasmidium cellare TaxID=395010 RepID=A0ABR0E1U1_ZASCE|nr:hypothetical protein PRZ48_013722 [Zasmidium cellare]
MDPSEQAIAICETLKTVASRFILGLECNSPTPMTTNYLMTHPGSIAFQLVCLVVAVIPDVAVMYFCLRMGYGMTVAAVVAFLSSQTYSITDTMRLQTIDFIIWTLASIAIGAKAGSTIGSNDDTFFADNEAIPMVRNMTEHAMLVFEMTQLEYGETVIGLDDMQWEDLSPGLVAHLEGYPTISIHEVACVLTAVFPRLNPHPDFADECNGQARSWLKDIAIAGAAAGAPFLLPYALPAYLLPAYGFGLAAPKAICGVLPFGSLADRTYKTIKWEFDKRQHIASKTQAKDARKLFEEAKSRFSKVFPGLEDVEWDQLPSTFIEYVKQHPAKSTLHLTLLLATTFPGAIAVPAYYFLGFSPIGPVAGSLAAAFQSMFGTPLSFSVLQSAAMGGYGVPIVNGIIRASAAAVKVGYFVLGKDRNDTTNGSATAAHLQVFHGQSILAEQTGP